MRYLILSLPICLLILNCVTAVRVVSPLKTFTLWDDKEMLSPREKYLIKFKAGMEAEAKVRKVFEKKHEDFVSSKQKDKTGGIRSVMRHKRRTKALIAKYGKKAYDKAFQKAEGRLKEKIEKLEPRSNYQIVGIIDKDEKKKIKWYARKRPSGKKWSLRIVHVDKSAIIKDLYNKGKIDVFAKYSKRDRPVTETDDEGKDSSKAVQIKGNYSVRERSWRTLWNFSPKHVFTDSSGHFFRERRVCPGLYTDGENVYETYYDYGNGKNKMRRKYKFDEFLQDGNIEKSIKDKAKNWMNKKIPDLVIES